MIRELRFKNKKIARGFGFTLVEMLVVISIIAILSAVLAGGYSNSQKSARDAARKINLKSISDALNSYYADNGYYPEEGAWVNSDGSFTSTDKGIVYMKKVPVESGNMVPIYYQLGPSKKSFRLFTNLENDEDKDCVLMDVCEDLNYDIENGCCYIVTSSNVGTTGSLN